MNHCISSIIIAVCLSGLGNIEASKYQNLMYSRSEAYFHSTSEDFKIKIGDDVTFPCHVNNKGSDVITWKNGIRLLTAGPIKVYNEDRLVHRNNGSEITLLDVQPRDEGEYACQLNTMDSPIELIHHLNVLIPPRIVPREAEVSVKAGSKVDLECVAHGNPAPTIRWRRLDAKDIKNTDGQRGANGLPVGARLSLEHIDRSMGGKYMCLASNGVEDAGEEIYSLISLQVQYPPEIHVEDHKRHYHPKLRQQYLSISCNVSADPAPDVNWQRGRTVLSHHDHKSKYQMSSKPIKDENTRMFILTIRNIREEDFGNYTCHATNSLGFDKHEIVVSGKPLPPTILPNKGSSKTEYTLRWKVDSAFPVREHNIYYERKLHGKKYIHQSGMPCYGEGECRDCSRDSCTMLKIRAEQKHPQQGWRRSLEDLQHLLDSQKEAQQILTGLVPDSEYQVKIQTINEFGRSHWSEEFEFDTFGAETQRPSIFSAFSSSSMNKSKSIMFVFSMILSINMLLNL